jgi:heterodisulfide reductase subunit B
MPQYEKAAKRVLEELGIVVENMPHAACCGAPLESFDDGWLRFAAYNLSLADGMGRDVVTLCGNCTNSLLRAKSALGDPSRALEVNGILGKLGLRFEGTASVRHLVQLLMEQLDDLRERVTREFRVKVAVTHPCQAIRPSEVMGFDDPSQPQAMRRIVELTGAEILDYDAEHDCCGSTLYLSETKLGLEAGRRKLAGAGAADVLVDACGNCQLLLERFQGVLQESGQLERVAVLTLPQLLGLAMDIEPDDLGVGPAAAEALLGSPA